MMLRKYLRLPGQIIFIGFSVLVLSFLACKEEPLLPPVAPVDETITSENAYIDLFLDSNKLYTYITENNLSPVDSAYILGFYRDRNYEFAWFDSSGMAQQARHFINLFNNFRQTTADSSLNNPALDDHINLWLDDTLATPEFEKNSVSMLEIQLTHNFFRYAERAFGIHDSLDLTKIGWYIPKRKLDAHSFLDSVIFYKGESIDRHLPVHPLFTGLQDALVKYTALARSHQFDSIAFTKGSFRIGDSSALIGEIKRRLFAFGDLAGSDTGNIFTTLTAEGVVSFQERYGLTPDSVAGPAFQRAINTPVDSLIQQIIVNLERSRWLPLPASGKSIFVNIPGYRLYARNTAGENLTMDVVVGTPATKTVIFNEEMKYVVFAPYWNVPYSIVKNEMGRTAGYFSRRNMEIVGTYSDGLPRVRQKPGPWNALGKVKFLFPNNYSIYLHDTPTKSSFSQSRRAFSHGCIRIEKPFELAKWVLDERAEFTEDSIRHAMNRKTELTVTVKNKIPVLIAYFTAWKADDGKLQFRPDVYGHDKALKQRLFENNKR